jgi:dihydrofolate reductase
VAGRRVRVRRDALSASGGAAAVCIAHIETEMAMGSIHVHEFMTLDGVIDAPTWTFDYGFLPRMAELIGAFTERSRGILLGRTTYEMFEPAWSTRTVEDDPGAPFFNDTTKYVVSGTLTEATWRNSEIIGPYDADRIRRLKDEVDGDLYVSGSGTLVRAMLADGLVDELHLLVYPLTRGSGPRLFAEGAAPGKLSLVATESFENGVVYLAYRPDGGTGEAS